MSADKDSEINGWVFGYDPGGNGKHGVAAVRVVAGEVRGMSNKRHPVKCATCRTVQDVVDWFERQARHKIAIGVDTLTYWGMGKSGDRAADNWLRKKYPRVKSSVMAPNSLHSAMSVNGIAVLLRLRQQYPNIHVTETHPKVLYRALTNCKCKYNYKDNKKAMDDELLKQLGLLPPKIKNDHEWDALISAYAALQGLTRRWTCDLAVLRDQSVFQPFDKVHYWWPEDDELPDQGEG